MHKRILSLFTVILVVLTSLPMVYAAKEPTLTVSSVLAKAGETVELDVSIQNNPGINTFSLGFDYDKSQLQLVDVAINNQLGGQFAYSKKAVWLNGKDVTYNGNILKLKFKVLDDAKSGKATVNLTYSSGDISNYNEKDVNFKVAPGTVTIESNSTNKSFIQKIQTLLNRIIELLKKLFATASN